MAAPQTECQINDQEITSPERELPDSPALKLWVVMARAHVAVQTHAAADIARHDLTLAEFGILEALYHRGPMLLGEVQRRILVSKDTAEQCAGAFDFVSCGTFSVKGRAQPVELFEPRRKQ